MAVSWKERCNLALIVGNKALRHLSSPVVYFQKIFIERTTCSCGHVENIAMQLSVKNLNSSKMLLQVVELICNALGYMALNLLGSANTVCKG